MYTLKAALTMGGQAAMMENHALMTDDVLLAADKYAKQEASGKNREPVITRDAIEIAIRDTLHIAVGRQVAVVKSWKNWQGQIQSA